MARRPALQGAQQTEDKCPAAAIITTIRASGACSGGSRTAKEREGAGGVG